jgi:hypothetical protein
MEAYCQNPLCENKAVKEVPVSVEKPADQARALCATCEEAYTWGVQHGRMVYEGLKIDPPPMENGDEPLFRVVYVIDVKSRDAHEAAEYTHRIMTDPESMQPMLYVVDFNGACTEIDLSEGQKNLEDTGKMVNYEAAAQYLADNGDRIFTGPMNGGLWNGRCMDACAMSKKQGDKAAYDFLLKFGDQYASSMSVDQQYRWQSIKEQAANILKGSEDNTCAI